MSCGNDNISGGNNVPDFDDEEFRFEPDDEEASVTHHGAPEPVGNSDQPQATSSGFDGSPEIDPEPDESDESVDTTQGLDPEEATTAGPTTPEPTVRTRTSGYRGTLVRNAQSVAFLVGIGVFILGTSFGGIYGWLAHNTAADAEKRRTSAEAIAAKAEQDRKVADTAKAEAVNAKEVADKIAGEAVTAAKLAEAAKKDAEIAKKTAMDESAAAITAKAAAIAAQEKAEEAKKKAKENEDKALVAKKTADDAQAAAFKHNTTLTKYVAQRGAVKQDEHQGVLDAISDSKVDPLHVKAILAAKFALNHASKLRAANDPGAEEAIAEALKLAKAAEAETDEAKDVELQVAAIYLAAQVLEIQGQYDDAIAQIERAIKIMPNPKMLARLKAALVRIRSNKIHAENKPATEKAPKNSQTSAKLKVRLVSALVGEATRAELEALVAEARQLVEPADSAGAADPSCWYSLALTYVRVGDHIKAEGKEPNIDAVSYYVFAINATKMALLAYSNASPDELDDLSGQLLLHLANVQEQALTGRLSFESNDVIEQLARDLGRAKLVEAAWADWAQKIAGYAPFKLVEQLPDAGQRLAEDSQVAQSWMKAGASHVRAVVDDLVLQKKLLDETEKKWAAWAAPLATDFNFEEKLAEQAIRTAEGHSVFQSWLDGAALALHTDKSGFDAELDLKDRICQKWTSLIETLASKIGSPPRPEWDGDPKTEPAIDEWQARFIKLVKISNQRSDPQREAEARLAFAKGLDFFFRRCRKDAEECFSAAIELAPRNPDAYYFRALTRDDNWWAFCLCGYDCQDYLGELDDKGEAAEDLRVGALLESQGMRRSRTFALHLEKVQGCARNWLDAGIRKAREAASMKAPDAKDALQLKQASR